MRRQRFSKSNSCTEGMVVDAAGISVKAGVHYPGRSVRLPRAMAIVRWPDGRTEVSIGHSKAIDPPEGLNM